LDLYFRGQAIVNHGFGPAEAIAARELFSRALEIDPNNVDALAALSQCVSLSVTLAFTPERRPALLEIAETAALRAVELAPGHAKAHHALAQLYSVADRLPEAMAEYRRALSLDRNHANAYAGLASVSIWSGVPADAEAYIAEAFRLSPLDVQGHLWCVVAGAAQLSLGEWAAAEAWFRRGIEINRSFPIQVFYLAAALAGQERWEEARACVRDGLALDPGFGKAVRLIRVNRTYQAKFAEIVDLLRRAGLPDG
jgi:tetratricopeptide (TPR) repeat protein